MSTLTSHDLEKRLETREPGNYPRVFVKVKSLDKSDRYNYALAVDISSQGIGLVTSEPYLIGERIELNIDNEYFATGTITHIDDEWDDWDWCGMVHMGVRIVEKTNWPL
ncbi:MAG: PilZ domain-containing protein [Acidobacteriota bacterium]